MTTKEIMIMGYNENLMNKALHGDKSSLEELKSNAGSGDCEAMAAKGNKTGRVQY
jgi:hypothetical protein